MQFGLRYDIKIKRTFKLNRNKNMRKYFFVTGIFLCMPFFALADAPVVSIKIISAPQNVNVLATSSVFTLEAQDAGGNKVNVATTTRISLSSGSVTGQFLSATATACNSTTVTTATIANGTSHKSFCYIDSIAGTYIISVSVADQPGVSGDSQSITISNLLSDATASTTTTTSASISTPAITSSTPASTPSTASTLGQGGGGAASSFVKTNAIKISEILPNPPGEDAGKEQVELQNTGSLPVSLDGWLLDDKTEVVPKTKAYMLSGQTIFPDQFLSFTIPKGFFALNNSGGETLFLYYPDKSVADSVSYEEATDESLSWQKISSVWVWAAPTLGQMNARVVSAQSPGSQVIISEFMPNPVGQDEGKEWAELYNPNSFPVSLKNFVLDDSGLSTPGSGSFVLPDSMVIPAAGYLQIIIPEGNFTLNNSGKDALRLFSPSLQLLEEVTYSDAPEDQSYFKNQEGKWQFGLASPGLSNLGLEASSTIIISEILPNPGQDEDEFVELYNPGKKQINLEKFILQVGDKKKVFDTGSQINSQEYFTVFEEDLPARLRNSGQKIKLLDTAGRLVAQASYGPAKQGMAYASNDGKTYAWTSSSTPASSNIFILGDATLADTASLKKENITEPKTKTVNLTKSEVKVILKSNQGLSGQVALLQSSVNGITQKLDARESLAAATTTALSTSKSKTSPVSPVRVLVWLLSIVLAGGAVMAGFWYVNKKS